MGQGETGNKLKRKGMKLVTFYKFCITVYGLYEYFDDDITMGYHDYDDDDLYGDGRGYRGR